MRKSLLEQARDRRVYFAASYSAATALNSDIRLNYSISKSEFDKARTIMTKIYGPVSRNRVLEDVYLFGLYQLAIEADMTPEDRTTKYKPISSEYSLGNNILSASIKVKGLIKNLGEYRVTQLYPDFFKTFNRVDVNSFIVHLGVNYLERVNYGQEPAVHVDAKFMAIINGDLANIVTIKSWF